MTFQHKELASGRWNKFSFFFQMANIGSEVGRALKWQQKDAKNSRLAAERALELLDLTIEDPKNHTPSRLKELWRLREFMADSLFFGNEYKTAEKSWRSYFDAFAWASALE
ncbi:MAG: hypothetical protein G01um101430_574 [Parcubacteria group bacterium Gr01-1014_30]|nr:MAG: hypothetical protein G01um101430_574 [Parcubacteria group bacterium Gr01-1014_30]